MTTRRMLAPLFALALLASGHSAIGSNGPRRVLFRVRTILTTAGASQTASDATVEGPPGTDLTLNTEAGDFAMTARFRTDLVAPGRVRVVANVTTRRRAGTSERGYPLYEEGSEKTVSELACDGSESLVVMPLGRNPGGDELAIDVLPTLVDRPARQGGPLEIHIENPGLDGWIRVEATKIPHFYDVEAELLDGGKVVASGTARCSIDEPQPIGIGPSTSLLVTVERPEGTCTDSPVSVAFDVRAGDAPIARDWEGVSTEGSPLTYRLGALSDAIPGKPDTLRIRIAPAEEEQ